MRNLSQFHQHKFSLTKSHIACCSCDNKSLFHKKCHTTSTFIIYRSFPAFSHLWYLEKMPSSKGLVNQCKIDIYVLASPIASVCLSVYLNWYNWTIYGGAVELDWMKWLLLTQCHQYREGFNLTRPQPSLGPRILLSWGWHKVCISREALMSGQVLWSVSVLLADDLFRLVYC